MINYKDLEKAMGGRADIRMMMESMEIDYVGDKDFCKLLDKFEKACEKVGVESFRMKFKTKHSSKTPRKEVAK